MQPLSRDKLWKAPTYFVCRDLIVFMPTLLLMTDPLPFKLLVHLFGNILSDINDLLLVMKSLILLSHIINEKCTLRFEVLCYIYVGVA